MREPTRESNWMLTLICCGMDWGREWFETWQEADDFRQSFCNPAGTTHERSAILTQVVRV